MRPRLIGTTGGTDKGVRALSSGSTAAASAFDRRVERLAATSAVMLGAIWWLAQRTPGGSVVVLASLVAGWISMPVLLLGSLRWRRLRLGLTVPSLLVCAGLLAICEHAGGIPGSAVLGWRFVTAGVLLGGLLGGWFWFGLAPIPAALANPFSRGRWLLIAIHVSLIVGGLMLIVLSTPG
jgi:hypothetical protein